MSRYDLNSEGENEFEPGSDGLVLKNKLGLTDPREIEIIESQLLEDAILASLTDIELTSTLTFETLCRWHKNWLGALYDFAGQVRRVNVSKGGILFAPIAYIDDSIKSFDQILANATPGDNDASNLVPAIARVHSELILIHPFREGNGRLGRWIADIMAQQAGFEGLNWRFDVAEPSRRDAYFEAMRTSFAGDLTLLEALVEDALTGS